MAENNIGRNIAFKIYNADGTEFNNLVLKKATYDTVVMALGDKISGDVYYKDNTLAVTMHEYIVYNGVKYMLINPPTIVREGMVADNSEMKGMTKYSFTFYHPMCLLFNFPFSDVAVTKSQEKYLSQNKSFYWIGNLNDFVEKLNKNLQGTEWVCEIGSTVSGSVSGKLSDVIQFDNKTIADALKIEYETWDVPYIIDTIASTDTRYAQGKRFLIHFGLPSQEIIDANSSPFVFQFGKGVGLKNNSRTPRNNKIITRIAGYGSENNIPYGYPQIVWTGNQGWDYTVNNNPSAANSYPIYDGIVNGQRVRLIKHPFTRNHLMPSIYSETVNKKVNPNAVGYNPNIEIKDYYDAVSSQAYRYPNPINPNAPSYDIHAFDDIKPELGQMGIAGVEAYDQEHSDSISVSDCTALLKDYYTESTNETEKAQIQHIISVLATVVQDGSSGTEGSYKYDWNITSDSYYAYLVFASSGLNFSYTVLRAAQTPTPVWDDTMDDDGKYKQSYFKIVLPQLSFDLYACAAITEEMSINMRSGACIGCTFPVMIDWDDYKQNFYDANGNFDPVIGQGHPRNGDKYPNSASGSITVIVQKDLNTFGTLMPNRYQMPYTNDQFVILGISLPLTYVTNAEQRLDAKMLAYMKENNDYYFDYPLKFDEHFLATHTNILSQMKCNTIVRFNYAGNTYALYIKQMSVKWGQSPLPQYDITLTDDVDVVLNPVGKVADDLSKLGVFINQGEFIDYDMLFAKMDEHNDQRYLSKISDDAASGLIRFIRGMQVGQRFVTGLLGEGGIFRREADGTTYLECDKMYVRMKAYFDTVEIRKFLHSGGNRIASLAGIKCSRVEYIDTDGNVTQDVTEAVKFRCYFRADNNGETVTNDFEVDDLAFCKETNVDVATGVEQHGYWRTVVGKNSVLTDSGEGWIDLSVTDCLDGSDVPKAQDDIIQLGNKTDKTRQGAIVEYVTGADAPAYQIYQGINTYSLVNKNYVRLGYDSASGGAQAFIGNPDGSSYLWYHTVTEGELTRQKLEIKAVINAQSTIGNQTLEQFVNSVYDASWINSALEGIQDQIDGAIETWFYNGAPSDSVLPESEWKAIDVEQGNNNERLKHLGDLYYDNETGYAYRYINTGTEQTPVFSWSQISDSAVVEALRQAAAAQDTADHKRRVFIAQPSPIPPKTYVEYDEGDLWANATGTFSYLEDGETKTVTYNNDLLRCITPKPTRDAQGLITDGTFSITDWQLASRYTDDTTVNAIISQYGNILGVQNPTAQNVGEALAFLRQVLTGNTTIDGGLILTHMIALKNGNNIMSGINGELNNELADPLKTPAAWYGGAMIDHEADPTAQNYAKTLFRFDGTGYLAGGNIKWNADGSGSVAGGNIAWNAQGNITTLNGQSIAATTSITINGNEVGTQNWVTQNFVSKAFFTALFAALKSDGTEIPVNDANVATLLDSIKARVGFWTESYMSALGRNSSGGGGGGSSTLHDLNDVDILSPMPQSYDGYVLTYNAATGKWTSSPAAQTGISSIAMTVPTGFSVTPSSITSSGTFAISFANGYSLPLTADVNKGVTAYGWGNHASAGYLTSVALSGLTDVTITSPANDNILVYNSIGSQGSTPCWKNIPKATFLNTGISGTFWGQSWSNSGTVSGNMSSVGNIAFAASGKNIGSILYFDTTNSRLGVGIAAPSYLLHVNGNSYLAGTLSVTGGATLASTLSVVGAVTLSTAKKIYFGDANHYIELDSNGDFHFSHGIYSDSYVSSLGVNSSGGGGTGDVTWELLASPATGGRTIHSSYIADALSGYATKSWVGSQDYITSAALNGYATEQWVTDNFNKYVLSAATANALGGIKIGYEGTGKNYPVQLDANNKAFVNVPWEGTTYSNGTGLTLTGNVFSITQANVSTILNLLSEGTAQATADDYIIAQSSGGGTTTTTYHRRKVSNVVNSTIVKSALGVGTGTAKYLREDGAWVTPTNTTYKLTVNGTTNGDSNNGVNLGSLYAIATSNASLANQVWMRNSDNTGYAWRQLGARAFDNTAYLPLAGGTLTGNLTTTNIIVPSGNTIKIGDAYLVWDNDNNAIKVYKLNGSTEVAVNLYATGGVSALGMSSSGGGGGSSTLEGLLDVEYSGTPSNGQVLKYNSATGKWYNGNDLNNGSVTQVNIGGTPYTPTNGVVSLPAYPTTLPASDVSAWAKAATKPSYTLDEVSDGSTRKLANYLSLSGGTMTGTIYRAYTASNQTPLIWMNGSDYDNYIWQVSDGETTKQHYGFGLKYFGTGDGNNNKLVLYADNQGGTDVAAYSITQDGMVTFGVTPKVGTSAIVTSSNWNSYIGTSSSPVGYSNSAETANMIKNNITVLSDGTVDSGIWFDNGTRKVLFGTGTSGNTGIHIKDNGWIVGLNSNNEVFLAGNAATATKLETSRTLWGQPFDGTANVSGSITGATTITASGLITANGGITIPSGKTLTIGDAVLSWDGQNQAIKITKGLYSETFISALGMSDGRGSGVDMETVWLALGNATSEQINVTHLSTALSSYATQTWVTQQIAASATGGTVTAVKVGTTTYNPSSGVVSLPAYPSTLDNIADGSTRKLANYLPLTGGTMTGNLTVSGTYEPSITVTKENVATDRLLIGSSGNHGLYTVGKGFWCFLDTSGNGHFVGNADSATTSAACSGNAATATKLQTARTINCTSFDGTDDITTTKWGMARNITIKDASSTNASTLVSVDGSADVTLLLPSTINASLTGNADTATTATKLSTTSKTAWGQTYWTSGGIPTNISGNMNGVGDITSSSSYSLRDSSTNPYLNLPCGSYNWYVQSMSDGMYIGRTSTISLKIDASGNVFIVGNCGIGTSSPSYKLHVNGTMGVNGNTTLSGALTLSTAKKIYFGDANHYVELDSNGDFHFSHGIYSDSYVSALGVNSSGGGGVGDVTWDLLADNTDTRQIALSHLTTALSGYATQSWVTQQISGLGHGTVTRVDIGTTQYKPTNGVVSLPAYPTSLPASDVYAWAKASTKPSYGFSEITGTAAASQIPDLSGTYAAVDRVNTLEGYFTSGVANSAAKLSTVSKVLFGNTYWTSGGVPTSIGYDASHTANLSYVGNIDSLLYFNTTNSTVGIGTSSPSYKLHVNGTMGVNGNTTLSGALTCSATATFGANVVAGSSVCSIVGFTNLELNTSGGLPSYGGFIDFHYGGSDVDYSSRIIEAESGKLSIHSKAIADDPSKGIYKGDSIPSGLIVGGGGNGSFVQIGNVKLVYDYSNDAIRVEKSNGTAANLYATGGISALGLSTGGSIDTLGVNTLNVQDTLHLKSSNGTSNIYTNSDGILVIEGSEGITFDNDLRLNYSLYMDDGAIHMFGNRLYLTESVYLYTDGSNVKVNINGTNYTLYKS